MLYYLAYQHCIGYEIIAGKFYHCQHKQKNNNGPDYTHIQLNLYLDKYLQAINVPEDSFFFRTKAWDR
jgi:hypothetical protein